MSIAAEQVFSTAELHLDPAAETERITEAISSQVSGRLRRKGVVLGLSGGIDSSVTAALCVHALGPERVLGLFMPERDGSRESLALGCLLAESLGIETVLEDIAPVLEAVGCYRARDIALARLFPEFEPGFKWKIVLPSLFDGAGYRVFSAVLQLPDGRLLRKRMPLDVYQQVVAATNYKQRVRKMIEYHHADRLHYAVAGTPNLLESDQGFFVKNGDGAADLKPIAHLYKSQVYQLAEHLDLPAAIRHRPPTTDTYSLEQTQEEFFFSLPYDHMDACLYGRNHGVPAEQVAAAIGLTAEQVDRVYADIDAKRRAARYLHEPPLCVPVE
ncbi:MAG: NAD(+) synthase [Thermoguttaceae bacterium]|jgi:NAD+ synthase|nr:NAD(+) synthase [Thermoguttaceae bacterium]